MLITTCDWFMVTWQAAPWSMDQETIGPWKQLGLPTPLSHGSCCMYMYVFMHLGALVACWPCGLGGEWNEPSSTSTSNSNSNRQRQPSLLPNRVFLPGLEHNRIRIRALAGSKAARLILHHNRARDNGSVVGITVQFVLHVNLSNVTPVVTAKNNPGAVVHSEALSGSS